MEKKLKYYFTEYLSLILIPLFLIFSTSTIFIFYQANLSFLSSRIDFLNSFLTLFGFTLTSYSVLFTLMPKFTENFKITRLNKKINYLFSLSLINSILGIIFSIIFLLFSNLFNILLILGILNIYFLLVIVLTLFGLYNNKKFYN